MSKLHVPSDPYNLAVMIPNSLGPKTSCHADCGVLQRVNWCIARARPGRLGYQTLVLTLTKQMVTVNDVKNLHFAS
jgi:hypothetical protein